MNEDVQLVQACRGGDVQAFEKIVSRYQSLVCAITYSAVGERNTSEELAQETFVQVWRKLDQLKELDKFRSWLCSIARSIVCNHIRTQKRSPVVYGEMEDMPADKSEHPEEAAVRREEEEMIRAALMRLPEEYRQPLVLFYRQDQSTRQVAELMGLPETTVRTRLHRGRQMLREHVEAKIETTLKKTAPTAAFTRSVMGAVGAGLAAGITANATAQTSGTATTVGGGTALTAAGGILTATAVKIAAIAAVVIIGAGVLVYNYWHSSDASAESAPQTAALPQTEQKEIAAKDSLTVPSETDTATETQAEQSIAPQVFVSEMIPAKNKENASATKKPYEFKPRGVLSGLITDADTGKPVTDAHIDLAISTIYFAKTDPNGFYYFDKIEKDGNHRIGIGSIDYVGLEDYDKMPIVNLQKDKQAVQHFQLKKACKVQVHVVDEDGRPIEKAEVLATVLSSNRRTEIGGRPMTSKSKYTDKEGNVIKGGFPPKDNYLITVIHRGPDIKVEGKPYRTMSGKWDYAPSGVEIYLDRPGHTEYVEVVLEKGQSVRGYAQYKDGHPAVDITISARPNWWHSNYIPQSVPVEPNGFFTLEQIVPDKYQIQANIPRGEGSSTGHTLFNCTLPLENEQLLEVEVPFNSPQSLAAICGTIRLKGSKKPNSIEISAYSRKFGHHSAHINLDPQHEKEATFCIDRLETGTYRLQFEGSEVESLTMENVQAPSENLEVELICAGKPKLYGMVMDATSKKPLNQFQIRLRKLQSLRGSNYVQQDQPISFTKEDGLFEVEVVGPGIYQVQAQAEGYAPVWSEQINTDNNAAALIRLTAGSGAIEGIVLNENGQPIKDAKVIPLSLACGTAPHTNNLFVSDKGAVTTDKMGLFRLTGLPAGQETLKVTHPNYAFTIVQDIQVLLNQSTDNIKIVLPVGGTIEGFVYDQEGRAEGGIVIYAKDGSAYSGVNDEKAGRLGTAVSEPNGFYQISGLPDQVCYLMRQNEWGNTGVVRRTVLPASGKTLHVDFGGTVCLRGQIILDDGPLASQKILLASEGNPNFGNYKAFTSTDAEGYFVFRGLIPARLAVYREQTDQRNDWVKLATIRGGHEDIDLGIIPKQMATVNVFFQQPEKAWNITYMLLKKDKAATETLSAKLPETPESPSVIAPVLAGDYKLQIYRDDQLVLWHDITVSENQKQVDITVTLPQGNATIYGTFSEKILYVLLWSADKKFQKTIINDGKGSYEVSNLPAGRYSMGLSPTLDEQNAISFDLAEGQQLMMNLDEHTFEAISFGMLVVQVYSTDGQMVEDATVYLENAGHIVEPYAKSGTDAIFMTQAGPYTLHITCEGFKELQQHVTLKAIVVGEPINHDKNKMMVRLERL